MSVNATVKEFWKLVNFCQSYRHNYTAPFFDSQCMCLCVGPTGEVCKNGWAYWAAVWEIDLCELKEPCFEWGSKFPMAPAIFRGTCFILL